MQGRLTSFIRMSTAIPRMGHSALPLRSLLCRNMCSDSAGRKSAAVEQNKQAPLPQEILTSNPPRGTRDFYPPDMRLRQWLFDIWRNSALMCGFEEYDAPVVEHEQLYIRKGGEQISQQLYTFEDKSGRRLALRPEVTPSLARMVAGQRATLATPIKWFSIPQCWRYERMSRGRKREHYQWNMDIWGVEGVQAEAELLGVLTTAFTKFGLTPDDVAIKVNNRKLLFSILRSLGVVQDKLIETCVLIDKLDKQPVAMVSESLTEAGWNQPNIDKLLQVLAVRDLEKLTEHLKSLSVADTAGLDELKQLWDLSAGYGYDSWLTFDASIVRGLSYYTGIVFEAFDKAGEFRAICGGGRYDKPMSSFGSDDMSAVGFGFGDAVIMELLKAKQLLPDLTLPAVSVVVFAMEEQLHPAAVKIAQDIRQRNIKCDLVLDTTKRLKWALKQAERLGANKLIIVAPTEYENKQILVKDLASSEQSAVSIADVTHTIAQSLASNDDIKQSK